jgi:hypothetical protein
MIRRNLFWLWFVAIAIRTCFVRADESLQYNRDIRPILAENCFACHGPDSASRKADLRLDRREVAIETAAIVSGKPEESSVVERVFSSNPDEIMPPPATKRTLTAAQKELLKKWIASGAEYQPHWSFIAPTRPGIPSVKEMAWVRNPIDAFVLAKLDALGLAPAPEADRRTLARRLSLDLTGLPPLPEIVETFVSDQASDAYERLVDQLMATPQWGEHRARYWLDAARYADTHGIHKDNYREMWLYRDWVIDAFNRNQSFDQFTIEQLAGDLLPNRTLEQQIASGFNRCNITTGEGGVIPEEYSVLYTRDRTETTAQVWLGLTAGCAVCHDHKFDPLTQRGFYEMSAFFNNTTQYAMDGNARDTPPVIRKILDRDQARYEASVKELAETRAQLEARRAATRADFDAWLAGVTIPRDTDGIGGLTLHAPLNIDTGRTLDFIVKSQTRPIDAKQTTWIAGVGTSKALQVEPATYVELPDVGDFEFNEPFSVSAWVKFTQPNQTGAIVARMEEGPRHRGWDLRVEGNRVGMHLIHEWPNNAIKVVANSEIKLSEWHHVTVTYSGNGQSAGIKVYYDGVEQLTTPQTGTPVSATTRTDVPFKLAQRDVSSRLNHIAIHDLRLYGLALNANQAPVVAKSPQLAATIGRPPAERSVAEVNELFAWWGARTDNATKQLAELEGRLSDEVNVITTRAIVTHVMEERNEPATAFLLQRGEYDKRGDPVTPLTPDFLPSMSADLPKNRLGFAQWLVRPENPLVSRVTVNRFWQDVFGTGILRTAGDFGISGELPANQELLDWLAVEFREGGWDVKRFFKLLVTSATYRQAAISTPKKLGKDPHNRFCSRGPRFRMDAEMVRDYALTASGLLTRRIGGPSVKPYQPVGVWESVAMLTSNTYKYEQDSGDNLYRRSLYTFWKRSAPPASMEIFNAPSREVCTVRRERTNTPLQALATLNDPQGVEAARHLAEQVLRRVAKDEPRLQLFAQYVLARPFRAEELLIIQSSLSDLREYYATHPDDARAVIGVGVSTPDSVLATSDLAAWTMLGNQLFNLDEVLNK